MKVRAREARGDGGRDRRGAHDGVLRKGTLSPEHSRGGLHNACIGEVFPVPVSSILNVGVHAVLDAIVDLLPSPADRGEAKGTDPVTKAEAARRPAADAPLSAFVFKTIVDPHAGRIILFRVYSGTSSPTRWSTTSAAIRRSDGALLLLLQGKTQTQVPEIQAGDIGAVAKLKDTQTGDTLCDKAARSSSRRSSFPSRLPRSPSSRRRAGTTTRSRPPCQRLLEEDPDLRVSRDAQTQEMLLSGMGQLHIEVRRRAPAQALQGRGQAQEAQDPVPGDDQGHGRGPRAATRSRRAATASSVTARSR